MNPWQLARESEHSQQIALFCFLAKATQVGFKVAHAKDAYTNKPTSITATGISPPVPELQWLHAIPNGGNRGDTAKSRAIEGGRMKAEGVKPGVLDLFWPLQRYNKNAVTGPNTYCGLYIEMKRPDLKSVKNPLAGLSDEQKEFGQFVIDQGYRAVVCYNWQEAAKEIQEYYEL